MGAARRSITPVEEGVDHDRDASVGGHGEESEEVVEGAVDAAIGDEAQEVEATAMEASVSEGGGDLRVLVERALGDGAVDARDIHLGDAACAEVEVADLAVAHLAVREPDVKAAGAEGGAREAAPEPSEAGHGGEGHGVVAGVIAEAKAVEDDEDHGPGCAGHGDSPSLVSFSSARGFRRIRGRRSPPTRAQRA
jgi:hypothetical protein